MKVDGPLELLSASGVIRKRNDQVEVDMNVVVGRQGEVRAGKLLDQCFTSAPEGVTILLSTILEETE